MTKRRGPGEGSLYQRGNGRWTTTIVVGRNSAGKRIRRNVYGKTKREVQEKLTRLQSQKLEGTLAEVSRMPLGGWLDRWLEDFARQSVRPSTLASYQQILKLHIKPHLGSVSVTKLSPVQVQGLYSLLQRNGKSPRLIQMVHAVLHRAMSQAVKVGLVRINPCHAVERPRVPKHEIQPLNADQLYALYVLAITTGMRQGELFGLQWGDIDLAAGVLSVRRTLLELNGKMITGEPKSRKGIRRISLPALAVETLQAHRKRMLREGHAGVEWVFCNTEGEPLRRCGVTYRSFRPILKRAGLPHMVFHSLRHASASLLLSQGIHPKVVQERLGHSQISVTLDTYSHVLQGMDAQAAESFDLLLSRTGT